MHGQYLERAQHAVENHVYKCTVSIAIKILWQTQFKKTFVNIIMKAIEFWAIEGNSSLG